MQYILGLGASASKESVLVRFDESAKIVGMERCIVWNGRKCNRKKRIDCCNRAYSKEE